MILYSIIFIIIWIIFCFIFGYTLVEFTFTTFADSKKSQYIDDGIVRNVMGFVFYIIGLALICFIELIRVINKIDIVEKSIDSLLNNDIELKFPQDMNRIEKS